MYQAATIALRRFYTTVNRCSPPTNLVQQLNDRSLIKVTGPDAADFIQGLITNDINHLNKGPGSMFAMFLNIKGRVLYDVLVYRNEDENTYLIEGDKESINSLHKHLKIYKIKKNVQIENYVEYNVYALYNSEVITKQSKGKYCETLNARYSQNSFPKNATEYRRHKDLLIYRDPRVCNLGYRIVTKANVEKTLNTLQNIVESVLSSKENNYKTLRYSLGVGEGVNDLPTANCTPLENNCDYLHGVSFHKGCYLGQELTARTYHTGVIRKRLLPLFFTKLPKKLPENNIITHENVALGRLRGIENQVGLGLLRINQVLELGIIQIGDGEAKVVKPHWWPVELPKEKMNVQKS